MNTNPGDVEAVRAYQAALLRAGLREEALQLYRFKLHCPFEEELGGLWDERGQPDRSRVCTHCDREVRVIETSAELKGCIEAGSCVAIPIFALSALDSLVDDPDVQPADVDGLCKVDVEDIINIVVLGTPITPARSPSRPSAGSTSSSSASTRWTPWCSSTAARIR